MDFVIDQLEPMGYFTRGAGGHHIGRGGLAQHSIEVYDFMKRWFGWVLPDDSIAVVALSLGDMRSTARWKKSRRRKR